MRNTFNQQIEVTLCNNFNTAIVDGQFPASGSFIEAGEFESVVFLIRVGTLTSALTCKVQQAATIDGTPKDITTDTVVIAADDDNEFKTIQVATEMLDINNDYNYVTLTISGAAGSDDYLDIIALGWGARGAPVTQPAAYSEADIVAPSYTNS